ncbi:MAG: hypothetical protein KZQ93_05785 [Candidatus Thiodiazotropha sp. (ex Monitilora ramsayi)]|nr:hypothetical protein [Candidatus Thiodiazotropha sp. (ex Monitilora ramsayi)]
MATVFEVQSQDIAELNDLNLTKLLKMLLLLEARSAGIAERAVEVALNIRVADGGEDGRIEWSNGPENTDYLPSRLVQFQNKATEMGPADCANEIVDRHGNLKRMVEVALDNGGVYILFTTQELNGQQKTDRIDAIRNKLKEIGKPYANTVSIDIYDAAKIQGWVNRYAPAITAVLNWVGRPLVNGLCTWEQWEKFDENHHFDYVSDQSRNKAIENLRTLLATSKKCARIIGLSGLGKTRLALEVCRGNAWDDGFSKRVVYIDASYGEPNLAGLICSWVRLGLDCLFVVDNCDLTLHKQLRREIEHPNSSISLLTLHYNPEKDSDTDPIQLNKMSDDLIKAMLEPVYGERISDLDRIVSFAQGFPQMAVLLANARLDQTKDMGSLTDDDLVTKMLWGGELRDQQTATILEACSLFDKFGIEQEREEEAKFIAEKIAGTDIDALYRCIRTFEERGVVNRAGRLAQIIPKPLAIRLAADWWRTTRTRRQLDLIENEMPGQLERSFCDQVAKLDFLPEVKQLTQNLCGDQGPFGQAEVILSTRGSRLFRSLVEVNPKATSDVLYKILSEFSHEQLYEISGDVRRNLVWALEMLCFHEDIFEKSTMCLLWLASAENEDWANNATGQFVQLFRTFLSGTEASPAARLAIIDEAIKADSSSIQQLAVKALGSALDTYGGTRTVGAEYQGSGEPLVEWRPKIWKEAFDYWISSIDRLTEIALDKRENGQLAKEVLASHIRGLIQRSREVMLALDGAIRKIVDAQGPLWPKALESIKTTISYDSGKMPADMKQKLQELVELLTPSSIEDRISLIITNPPYEHEEGEDGDYIDIAAVNATNFAHEFAEDINVLKEHLNQLLVGEQRQGYWFGRNLVLASEKYEPLLSESISLIQKVTSPNINFILGMLDALHELNSKKWTEYIAQFKSNISLNKYYPNVIRTGVINEEHLCSVVDMIEAGRIKETSASVFTYGRALDHLSPVIVIRFVERLRVFSINAAWISLDVLSMYCHGNKERWESCKSKFKDILIDLPLARKSKGEQLEVYHWNHTAKKLLKEHDADFAKRLTQRILLSCNDKIDYGDMHHYIKPIVRILLRDYGQTVFPLVAGAIKDVDPNNQFYLNELFSKEDSFSNRQTSVLAELSEDVLHEWCKAEPDTAPLFLARSTDVYIEGDDSYTLSPRVQFLIDEFGDNKKVLSELSANMGSFGWSGSVVPIYKKEIAALQPFLKHKNKLVQEWIGKRILYLTKAIKKESMLDEEQEWGVY